MPHTRSQITGSFKESKAFERGHVTLTDGYNGSKRLKYKPQKSWLIKKLSVKNIAEIAEDEGVAHSTVRNFILDNDLEDHRMIIGHRIGNDCKSTWDGHDVITGTYWGRIMRGAEKRNIIFDISPCEAYEIYLEQDGKCALSGLPIFFGPQSGNGVAQNPVKGNGKERQKQTASLDRRDSNKKIYRISNCQWVHCAIQIMKNRMSDNELIAYAKIIYEHNFKNEN